LAFLGVKPDSPGFFVASCDADELLRQHPSFAAILKPYFNGVDLNSRPVIAPERYVIDFTGLSLEEAAKYEPLLVHLERNVKPNCPWIRWWQFNRPAAALGKAVTRMAKFLASARVTKHLAFQFVPATFVYSDKVVAIARSDWTTFTVLSSSLHLVWAEALGTRSMAGTFNYQPTECVQTMAFPSAVTKQSLEGVGSQYYEHRSEVMKNQSEGLTDTYNRFHDSDKISTDIQNLRELPVELDNAVAATYGWTDLNLGHGFHDTKQGIRYTISEPARSEVLARLLKLNHERYAEEVAQGLHEKKPKSAKLKPKSKPTANRPDLFAGE